MLEGWPEKMRPAFYLHETDEGPKIAYDHDRERFYDLAPAIDLASMSAIRYLTQAGSLAGH